MAKENSRRFTSLAIGMLIIFSAMAVLNITSICVRAETFTDDWEIYDHQWRENTNITLDNCNLTIKSGGILTFNNSVILEIINPQADPHRHGIKIEQNGKFEINSSSGSTFIKSETGSEGNTYWFLNSGTIDFLGATVERVFGDPDNPDTTGGIRNLPGSTCNLTNCNIMDGDTHGVYIEDNVVITIYIP